MNEIDNIGIIIDGKFIKIDEKFIKNVSNRSKSYQCNRCLTGFMKDVRFKKNPSSIVVDARKINAVSHLCTECEKNLNEYTGGCKKNKK